MVLDDRFRYQLTILEVCILIGLSELRHTHIAYEIALQKSPLVNGLMQDTISHAGL